MASNCILKNSKKKLSSTNVSPTTPVSTTTTKVEKDANTQKKEDNTVKKDTLSAVVSSKDKSPEYPEMTDTLKIVTSGYFLLKEELEALKKEVSSLKIEINAFTEEAKALKFELETMKNGKDKK